MTTCPKNCPRRRGLLYVDVDTRQPLRMDIKLAQQVFPKHKFPAHAKFLILERQA